ncbi:hypothetical protein BU23DRAFT_566898 [Bimuria novae-zelandiae CBS 107.79]|uniref:Mid2 domain-containing protein n=1 Tax=Bimuria novae-zelandiae CBS 107.79 TaxID=1447943 RepID=A0A6A5VG11_9PLEO|nr:hypothetical protein BU23DRAFT_566898 [Bimuria novae-zelandiae CBS 107.79]
MSSASTAFQVDLYVTGNWDGTRISWSTDSAAIGVNNEPQLTTLRSGELAPIISIKATQDPIATTAEFALLISSNPPWSDMSWDETQWQTTLSPTWIWVTNDESTLASSTKKSSEISRTSTNREQTSLTISGPGSTPSPLSTLTPGPPTASPTGPNIKDTSNSTLSTGSKAAIGTGVVALILGIFIVALILAHWKRKSRITNDAGWFKPELPADGIPRSNIQGQGCGATIIELPVDIGPHELDAHIAKAAEDGACS